jgi:hypothetical protein
MADLPALGFSLFRLAAKPRECFKEEGLDIVRLKTHCFGPFHVFTDFHDLARVHDITHQGPVIEKVLDAFGIQGFAYGPFLALEYLGVVAESDCLQEKLAEALAAELELAQDIEYPARPSLARFLQLFQKQLKTSPSSVPSATRVPRCIPPSDRFDGCVRTLFQPIWIHEDRS